MVHQVMDGIYLIEVPLPNNPLRSVNSYVIMGDDVPIVVDTAMNREECRSVLEGALSELGIAPGEPEVFVTHMHVDHLGLAPMVSAGRTNVYLGKGDASVVGDKGVWRDMVEHALKHGFPREDPEEAMRKHPGFRFGPLGPMRLVEIEGGFPLEVGNYRFVAVHTPGHSNGHMCLYEPDKRFMFSGDHILGDITPNVSLWNDREDGLTDYLASLRKVLDMNVVKALPGHRGIVEDPSKRIGELIAHHEARAAEVETILGREELDAFTVASRMTWDMTYPSFGDFPLVQKWFAMGEALAHLRFLEAQDRAKRVERNGKALFRAL